MYTFEQVKKFPMLLDSPAGRRKSQHGGHGGTAVPCPPCLRALRVDSLAVNPRQKPEICRLSLVKPVVLKGPKLTLSMPRPSDAETLYRRVLDSRVIRWLGSDGPKNLADERKWVRRTVPQGWKKGTALTWTMYRDGEVVGNIDLHAISAGNRSAEVGLWVAPDHQGNGYATEACRLVLDFGFKKMGLNRMTYKLLEGNKPSESLAKKLGFRYEGRLKQAIITDL